MKKLLAITVIFALVAGAAFAEISVSGAVHVGVDVISGTDVKGLDGKSQDPGYGGQISRSRLEASGESEDGKFGAWLRYDGIDVGANALAWWKPIDMFKLTLGGNPDGMFGKDGVTRWGFYQTAGDLAVAKEDWAFGGAFFGGWGDNGAVLTITPTDMIEINLAIPFITGAKGFSKKPPASATLTGIDQDSLDIILAGYDKGGSAVSVFMASTFQVAANLDFGTIALTMAGFSPDAGAKLYAYYGGNITDTIEINFGVGFALGKTKGLKVEKDTDATPWDPSDDTFTVGWAEGTKKPISVGLGANVGITNEFGLKVRVQADIPQESAEKIGINFGLLPYYKVSDDIKAYLGFELKYEAYDDALMAFRINPYIEVAGIFFAGVRIESANQYYNIVHNKGYAKSSMTWTVPIGLAFGF